MLELTKLLVKYSSNTILSFLMGFFCPDFCCKKTHRARLCSLFTPQSEQKIPRSKKQPNIARVLKYSSRSILSFLMGSFSAEVCCKKVHRAQLCSIFAPPSPKKFPGSKKQPKSARVLNVQCLRFL